MPGFEFRPEALISGQVFVGVRHFNAPALRTTPDFTGVVADVNATYTLRATQLQLRASRDLVYSYEPSSRPTHSSTPAWLSPNASRAGGMSSVAAAARLSGSGT